jgi:hypothetical protein
MIFLIQVCLTMQVPAGPARANPGGEWGECADAMVDHDRNVAGALKNWQLRHQS